MVDVLITGSAGFIGGVAYERFKHLGHNVHGVDWRKSSRTDTLVDVARACSLNDCPPCAVVLHCAAQTAVTRSVVDPREDIRVNGIGAIEIGRYAKEHGAAVIYTSTNKVFGEHIPPTPVLDAHPVFPQTPYGISKFIAERYVMESAVASWIMRQSCIYGPSQTGSEDQGWVAWLAKCARGSQPVTCYGDGTQVRDLLHVDDLVRLFAMILSGDIKPGTYTVGGGERNAVTFEECTRMLGCRISEHRDWRPFDQRYFVSANEGICKQGWSPEVNVADGVPALV